MLSCWPHLPSDCNVPYKVITETSILEGWISIWELDIRGLQLHKTEPEKKPSLPMKARVIQGVRRTIHWEGKWVIQLRVSSYTLIEEHLLLIWRVDPAHRLVTLQNQNSPQAEMLKLRKRQFHTSGMSSSSPAAPPAAEAPWAWEACIFLRRADKLLLFWRLANNSGSISAAAA